MDREKFQSNSEIAGAGEEEMILKVEACGICAGDVKAFAGAPSFSPEIPDFLISISQQTRQMQPIF